MTRFTHLLCLALSLLVAVAHGETVEPLADAFKIAWEPVLKSRMQYFTATHIASKRVLPRLKLAWCVSDQWAKLKAEEAAAARNAWAQATAQGVYDRLAFAESPEGIKAAKLAEAASAADTAKQAAEAIAKIKVAYPLEKLPTVTVTAAEVVKVASAPELPDAEPASDGWAGAVVAGLAGLGVGAASMKKWRATA